MLQLAHCTVNNYPALREVCSGKNGTRLCFCFQIAACIRPILFLYFHPTLHNKTRVQHFSDAKASAYVLSGPDTWSAVFEGTGTSERVGDWGWTEGHTLSTGDIQTPTAGIASGVSFESKRWWLFPEASEMNFVPKHKWMNEDLLGAKKCWAQKCLHVGHGAIEEKRLVAVTPRKCLLKLLQNLKSSGTQNSVCWFDACARWPSD